MADKPIGDLTLATAFAQSDLLVMEQGGVAKSVTGQVLKRDLAKMLDGHGGIKDIQKVGTAGLEDSYQITLSDGTKFEYYITNGRDGIDGAVGERGPSGTPKNWLDNSYFRVPVNQSGQVKFAGEGPAIDRWQLVGYYPEMEISSAGVVKLAGVCRQAVTPDALFMMLGKTVTVAAQFGDEVLCASGVLSVDGMPVSALGENNEFAITTYYDLNIGEMVFEITGGASNAPKWAALYIGEYTKETLPEYQYKGYAAELMECRRYYIAPDAVSVDVEILPDGEAVTTAVSGTLEKRHIALDIPRQALGMILRYDEQTLTEEQKAQARENIGVSGENANQGGLSATASALLINILRNAVYTADQSASITALENALFNGGTVPDVPVDPDIPDEPDEPVAVVYGLHQVDQYAGSLNTEIKVNTPVDKIVLTVDVKASCTKGSSFILSDGVSGNIAWTKEGNWSTCTADIAPADFVGAGKKTITITPEWNKIKNSNISITAFAGFAPEMVWYSVELYNGDTLLARLKPTATLGDMYDEVRDQTFSFTTTEGLTLVEG